MKTMMTWVGGFALSFAAVACGGGDEEQLDDGTPGTGGAEVGTGGAGDGSGGAAAGTGGLADGTGGADEGTGGETPGTGGDGEGSGGAGDGTGGTGGDEWVPGELLDGTSAQICEIQIACDYQFLEQAECVTLFDLLFQQAQIDECYTCLVENPDCDTQFDICLNACSI